MTIKLNLPLFIAAALLGSALEVLESPRGPQRARAFDIKTSIFHSSPAWMPPVSWSGRGRMSPNSNKEIA
ncbi:MAG TPA: hypothetical protein VNO18_00630 [Xanthobacteraceae bacterium]|nr:hypothetical protein [Xanthobacteraceae bacterium]